ncbi:MAG: 5'-methylthioadenosine/adenosylhomocysteine nucleosidase [Planctomycetota bacterium]
MVIGLMSAMPEELELALHELADGPLLGFEHGGRTFHTGRMCGRECVAVFSRWGKVAAATTATELISRFGVQAIVFTGVAGGLAPGLHVGDIVVADKLYQHDMDARPLFPRFEVPLTGRAGLETDASIRESLVRAASAFVEDACGAAGGGIGPAPGRRPRVVVGTVVSGDRFIARASEAAELRAAIEGAVCVEMEGAAVAQVCAEYGVPFGVVRVISDAADEHAPGTFHSFVETVASRYSVGIARRFLLGRRNL